MLPQRVLPQRTPLSEPSVLESLPAESSELRGLGMDLGSEGWASKEGQTMTEEQAFIEGWT